MRLQRTLMLLVLSGTCLIAVYGGNVKKAILVVSFGTSYEDNLKLTIEATEKRIAAAFPDYEVRRAFTSSIVIKVLKKKGILVNEVDEGLAELAAQGFTECIVQPLHLITGEEYHQVVKTVAKYRTSFSRLAIGMPLFAETAGYFRTLDAICANNPTVGSGEAIVFMGHGTHHPANSSYALIQMILEAKGFPVYVGTVEGYPDLDWVMDRLDRDGIKMVTLLPLMLVAGDHANNDMAGDEADSWKSILTEKGFAVRTILRGLGEVPAVQDIYVSRVREVLASIDSADDAD